MTNTASKSARSSAVPSGPASSSAAPSAASSRPPDQPSSVVPTPPAKRPAGQAAELSADEQMPKQVAPRGAGPSQTGQATGYGASVTLPKIEAMRAVGYLESQQTMKRVWAWAKSHSPDDSVWPTPVEQEQDGLRFNECGWPSEGSTPEDWLAMLQYWTVLREQLIGGAARSARKAVTSQLKEYEMPPAKRRV